AGDIIVNATPIAPYVDSTTYDLIGYGSFSGNLSDFALGNSFTARQRLGSFFVNDTSNHAIAVTVSGGHPVWAGTNGGIWTTGTTGSVGPTPAWVVSSTHAATDFWTTDTVEFSDRYTLGATTSAPATTTVTIHGNVSPNSTTFDNSGAANGGVDYT